MLTSIDPDTLARLRAVVGAGQAAPPDLARAALEALEATAAREERIDQRNWHIRRAALLIDGTAAARARALAEEAARIDRAWQRMRREPVEAMTVRGELMAARRLHRLPRCDRQYRNIIDPVK